MGMDSFLFKTDRKRHEAYVQCLEKIETLQSENASKIAQACNDVGSFVEQAKKKYPMLKHRLSFRRDPVSTLLKELPADECEQLRNLNDRLNELSGTELIKTLESLSLSEKIATWRKPYGLHALITMNFAAPRNLGDNTTRIPLYPENVLRILNIMDRSISNALRNDLFFGCHGDFWTIKDVEAARETFKKAYDEYKDSELIYYYAWY